MYMYGHHNISISGKGFGLNDAHIMYGSVIIIADKLLLGPIVHDSFMVTFSCSWCQRLHMYMLLYRSGRMFHDLQTFFLPNLRSQRFYIYS